MLLVMEKKINYCKTKRKKYFGNTCAFDTKTPNWLLPELDITNETD
jgi:hypothetical protein